MPGVEPGILGQLLVTTLIAAMRKAERTDRSGILFLAMDTIILEDDRRLGHPALLVEIKPNLRTQHPMTRWVWPKLARRVATCFGQQCQAGQRRCSRGERWLTDRLGNLTGKSKSRRCVSRCFRTCELPAISRKIPMGERR